MTIVNWQSDPNINFMQKRCSCRMLGQPSCQMMKKSTHKQRGKKTQINWENKKFLVSNQPEHHKVTTATTPVLSEKDLMQSPVWKLTIANICRLENGAFLCGVRSNTTYVVDWVLKTNYLLTPKAEGNYTMKRVSIASKQKSQLKKKKKEQKQSLHRGHWAVEDSSPSFTYGIRSKSRSGVKCMMRWTGTETDRRSPSLSKCLDQCMVTSLQDEKKKKCYVINLIRVFCVAPFHTQS